MCVFYMLALGHKIKGSHHSFIPLLLKFLLKSKQIGRQASNLLNFDWLCFRSALGDFKIANPWASLPRYLPPVLHDLVNLSDLPKVIQTSKGHLELAFLTFSTVFLVIETREIESHSKKFSRSWNSLFLRKEDMLLTR